MRIKENKQIDKEEGGLTQMMTANHKLWSMINGTLQARGPNNF